MTRRRFTAGLIALTVALPFAFGCVSHVRIVSSRMEIQRDAATRAAIVRGDALPPGVDDVLEAPGISLTVVLDNAVRLRATKSVGAEVVMVPVEIEGRGPAGSAASQEAFKIDLRARTSEPGFEFDPSAVILSVDGTSYGPIRCTTLDYERGGLAELRRPAALEPTGVERTFYVTFDLPAPDPERDIRLDLSSAFRHETLPGLPPIRFTPVRWSSVQ